MCDYEIEKGLLKKGIENICGVDEVGRGALFGPVVAGAVILDPNRLNKEIKDSKKLSHRKRLLLARDIYRTARAYSIGWCWNDEIDQMNILQATRVAMKMAIRGLQINPDYALIDGMKPDFFNVPGEGVINGDNRSISIAAASIIAKVFRDTLVISFSRFFPAYDFENNKGYPTQKHLNVISLEGITEFHRKSFRFKGF
jgi:ribonuclease HII